jgi:LysM repeat protein
MKTRLSFIPFGEVIMLRLNRFIPVLIGCVALLSGAMVAFAQDASYTVTTGDSLDKIGAIYDVQAACLAKTNNIGVSDMLKVGQVLTISFTCPLYDGVDNITTPREVNKNVTGNSGQGGGGGAPASTTYQVQRGDSLDSIGQALNISVVSLQKTNNLTSTILQPGQELTIPTDGVPFGQVPGSASDSSASAGQGGGGGAPAATTAKTTATDLKNGDATYVVQYQDTLDKIGALYDVKVSCLASDNNIADPAKVYPGQVLSVKTSCPRYDGFDVVINPRSS